MLQGSLDNFTLDEVLALLASTHKTGHLRLSGDRGTGSLWVEDGEMVGAEASNAPGVNDWEDIMFELLRFQSGNFSFIAEEAPPKPADPVSVQEMVDAGKELIIEWRGIESVVPTLDHVLAPVPELPSEQVMLTNSEWEALQSVGEGASVGEACRTLSVGELKGCRRIKGIVERGLVSISDPATAVAAAVAEAEAQAIEAEELAAEAEAEAHAPEPDMEYAPSPEGSADAQPVFVDAPVLDPASLAASEEDIAEGDRPPMPAPPRFGTTVGTNPPPPPAPPSPAEITSFSNNLTGSGDLSAGPPNPPAPPAPPEVPEVDDAADDEASLLMRYLQSDS